MTKIIQLFAGPGTGKSTAAAGLFSLMKYKGYNIELVGEFAKDLVWAGRQDCLKCQPYVFGEQYYRIHKLLGKVDYIVTDSPILLSCIYMGDALPDFARGIIEIFKGLDNINILLERSQRPYNPKGRNQTIEESKAIDLKIKRLLLDNSIPFAIINSESDAASKIFDLILN